MLNYISSHDTELFDRGHLIEAGTALLLAPGAAQIYYGDETARPPGVAPAGRWGCARQQAKRNTAAMFPEGDEEHDFGRGHGPQGSPGPIPQQAGGRSGLRSAP